MEIPYLRLSDGISMPQIGFGTAGLGNSETTKKAINIALDAGYRHFDTASFYNNEKEIGQILQERTDIPRQELFIATKLWNSDHGYEKTKKAFHKSLDRLHLDYIDLYLTHWPVPKLRKDSWKAMEELQDEGLIRSIGVSNYTIRHLNEMKEYAIVMPVINQVEFNPFLNQKDLYEYCQSHKIILEAYSPILACIRKRDDDPILNDIAARYNKSIAQIAIRWSFQLNNSVIPKSSNFDRIHENKDILDFQLTLDEMDQLNSLNEDLRLEWDPTDEP